jgi:hypothetical protein
MKPSEDEGASEERYRRTVWNYFKLHANQRIILFRFYIIFFSLFAIVIGHLISEFHFVSIYQEFIVIVLSIVFILVTVIFWLLDNRNRYFIHNAEAYFKKYEEKFINDPAASTNRFIDIENKASIFTQENNDSRDGKCTFRHTACFRFIYLIGIGLSVIFVFFSCYSICHHEDNVYYQIKMITGNNLENKDYLMKDKNKLIDVDNINVKK